MKLIYEIEQKTETKTQTKNEILICIFTAFEKTYIHSQLLRILKADLSTKATGLVEVEILQ